MKVNVFWFRRDLRLDDNRGLSEALQTGLPVLPLFIFDTEIIEPLPNDDPRITFIYGTLQQINAELKKHESSLFCVKGTAIESFTRLVSEFEINTVYTNKDYEPQAIERDKVIADLLATHGINFKAYKDQVIFEEQEVVKDDGTPYTVYTPFMRKWRARLSITDWNNVLKPDFSKFYSAQHAFPTLGSIGFRTSSIKVKDVTLDGLESYSETRDLPAVQGTSLVGPHLRFGTLSVRQLLKEAFERSETYVNELVWREFFMQILFNFPHVVNRSFKAKYDAIRWLNDEEHFKRWCEGRTGYPIVDAGMRELNATGYMHNRVRMITASFLVKHLLIDWRWGEAYFAEKLLDYELSSNNGNWQWVAGCGCDAAPYFRIFNPWEQQKKFDQKFDYILRWVPEFSTHRYPSPIIDHQIARKRALEAYSSAFNDN